MHESGTKTIFSITLWLFFRIIKDQINHILQGIFGTHFYKTSYHRDKSFCENS